MSLLWVLRGGGGAIKEPPLMHHSQKFKGHVFDDVQPGVELLAGFHQMKRKSESEEESFPHFLIDGMGLTVGTGVYAVLAIEHEQTLLYSSSLFGASVVLEHKRFKQKLTSFL